ncbi:hypothetical protein EDD53_1882 [Pacificibacter maritimus]|uniref:Uncharacterized protein n=1 Tax=Pacificibacter maritimus TaxID=762213 RepID=A0A3N4UAG5_9RHOB|nr:hypothetical protein EDD53_1882 [Pacificibacter maritimus]
MKIAAAVKLGTLLPFSVLQDVKVIGPDPPVTLTQS